MRNKRTASRAALRILSHTVCPEPRAPRLDSEFHMPEDLLHTEAGAASATQQIKAAQQKNLGRGRGVAVGGHGT